MLCSPVGFAENLSLLDMLVCFCREPYANGGDHPLRRLVGLAQIGGRTTPDTGCFATKAHTLEALLTQSLLADKPLTLSGCREGGGCRGMILAGEGGRVHKCMASDLSYSLRWTLVAFCQDYFVANKCLKLFGTIHSGSDMSLSLSEEQEVRLLAIRSVSAKPPLRRCR